MGKVVEKLEQAGWEVEVWHDVERLETSQESSPLSAGCSVEYFKGKEMSAHIELQLNEKYTRISNIGLSVSFAAIAVIWLICLITMAVYDIMLIPMIIMIASMFMVIVANFVLYYVLYKHQINKGD